ncbi:MAG: hypothetical protein RIT45_1407 [Pseudomonadota bacterium]|jgi:uncharacterized membrane protein YphA (DoxX/SURF4 family)
MNTPVPTPTGKVYTGARLVLGLVFFVFGLNGFFGFIPQPEHTGAAGAFLGGLASASYFFPLLKGTEVLVGLALLTHRLVPLALVVLAPITLNILAFHAFLEPSTVAMSMVLTALHLGLAWQWRQAYAPLLPQGSSAPRVVVATTAARAV